MSQAYEIEEVDNPFLYQFRNSSLGQLFNEDTTGGFIQDKGVRDFCNNYEDSNDSYIQTIQYLQSMGAVLENNVGIDYWVLRNEISQVDRDFDPELYAKARSIVDRIKEEVAEQNKSKTLHIVE